MIAYFGRSYSSAALVGGDYLSVADTRALIGDTISVRYYSSSESSYVDVTGSYVGSGTIDTVYSDTSFDSVFSGAPYILYRVSTPAISPDPNFITVRTNPSYSVIDTDVLHTFIACSFYSDAQRISSSFTSPSWNWSNAHYENSATDSNGHKAYFRANYSSSSWPFSFVPVDITSNSSFSAFCQDANFYGNSAGGYGVTYIAIGLPYLSSSSSVHPGTDVSGGGSGSSGTTVNINVDVDMEETNGLLEGIQSTLSGIVSGIKNLFIPSSESLEVFEENMSELLEAHLGGLYDAADIISGIWTQFENTSAKQSITIPQCSVPLAGEDLVLGGWTVPLKVQGMPSVLYESLAWIIDFLAVAAFINMCRNKLEIFLNPDSEVVQNDN